MKDFPKFLVLIATACAALTGCANNEFTRASTRAPDSAAEQHCGGQAEPLHSRSKADPDHSFCMQQMQGDDRQG
jgi:hypothetical protein